MKQTTTFHQTPTPPTLANTNYNSAHVPSTHKNPTSSIRDYVYSSETKNRENYTLKNMLSMGGHWGMTPAGMSSPN